MLFLLCYAALYCLELCYTTVGLLVLFCRVKVVLVTSYSYCVVIVNI